MRKFKLNKNLYIFTIPGYGALHQKQIVVGDEFAKYSPKYLTEIIDPSIKKEKEEMKENNIEIGITLMPESLLQSAIPEITFEEKEEAVEKEEVKVKKGGRPKKSA